MYRVTEEPEVYIDVWDVAELKSVSTEPNLTLGGNMSLTEAMNLFYSLAEKKPSYKYTKVLADHIDLIANVPVRNVSKFKFTIQNLCGFAVQYYTLYSFSR